jgi:hypothetical protein
MANMVRPEITEADNANFDTSWRWSHAHPTQTKLMKRFLSILAAKSNRTADNAINLCIALKYGAIGAVC